MKQVRGIKVKLEQILDSDAPDASVRSWVVPKKATILSGNSGTLIQVESNEYFLVPVGEWFQSVYNGKAMPQVDDFNKLQDMGFTVIKDKIVRNEEQPKQVVKSNGQELRNKDNVSSKKISKAVGTNSSSQKKD